VTVEWTKPEDDGGGDIIGYVISYGCKLFADIGHDYATMNVVRDTTHFTFTDQLKKRTNYHFAVAAVNSVGRGEFSEFSDYIYIWPSK